MVKACESCGMPMEKEADFGAGNMENRYCVHCTDSGGKLKSREEIRAGMVAFYMKANGSGRDEAARFVDAHMAKMPAWK